MKIDRRTFIGGAALGTAGLLSASGARGAEHVARALPAFSDTEAFWQEVRAQFLVARDLAYFNTGGLGPTSLPALTVAEETTRQLQVNSEHGHGLLAGARAVVAGYFGAQPDEIAFVRNASEANSIVASGLALKPGDEVIFETHAHPGGSYPWMNQANIRGIVVRLFEPDAQDPKENLARVAALMTARTRVVQVSHVTAPTGIVMPVAEIGRLCRERGVWFHIDGAQSAGMFPFTMKEVACDSFATSGHKWLNGPLETGVLFVRQERLNDIAPTHVGAYSGDLEFLPGEFRLASTAMRFEYGTRSSAAALGLAEAIKFQQRIGPERVAARGRFLAERVRAGLAKVPKVEILTPSRPEMSASIITFRTAAIAYDKLFGRLLGEHRLRTRPVSEQKLNALRVSTHIFNSPAECDALVAAVGKMV